jgi:polyferredoxin
MSPQPNLLSSNTPQASAANKPSRQAPSWLRRSELILRVVVRLYIGLILVVLPWTHFWTDNRFFIYFSFIARFTISGAFRGFISGVGFLNIWIAISDAVHYKES